MRARASLLRFVARGSCELPCSKSLRAANRSLVPQSFGTNASPGSAEAIKSFADLAVVHSPIFAVTMMAPRRMASAMPERVHAQRPEACWDTYAARASKRASGVKTLAKLSVQNRCGQHRRRRIASARANSCEQLHRSVRAAAERVARERALHPLQLGFHSRSSSTPSPPPDGSDQPWTPS